MTHKIAYLPGDGVGPEVASAARSILDTAAETFGFSLEYKDCLFGGAAIDDGGDPFPAATKEACAEADAVLLGAVGGPKWDGGPARPEAGLLALRTALGVFANLRPIRVQPGLEAHSPLKEEIARDVDILIIRELNGGVYYGKREEGEARASDECVYTREEVERVARIAFEAARGRKGRLVSVDKANVLATSRLWRAAVNALHEKDYADVELSHALVDAMAMKLIAGPQSFDVLLTENMFGDILSDEASVLAGSIGLAPSASLGEGGAGLYEPIHGSAPDIAGAGKANPVGAILSAAMLLRHSLGLEDAARAVERAVEETLAAGAGTPDLGGAESTGSMTDKIRGRVRT